MSYNTFLTNYRTSTDNQANSDQLAKLQAKQAEYLANKQIATKTEPKPKTDAEIKAEIKQSNTISTYGNGKKSYDYSDVKPFPPKAEPSEPKQLDPIDYMITQIGKPYNDL